LIRIFGSSEEQCRNGPFCLLALSANGVSGWHAISGPSQQPASREGFIEESTNGRWAFADSVPRPLLLEATILIGLERNDYIVPGIIVTVEHRGMWRPPGSLPAHHCGFAPEQILFRPFAADDSGTPLYQAN